MSIAGNLRTMAFADLVQWLSGSEKTGTLVIEGATCTKRVYLRRGTLAAIASDRPRDMLGYYLVGWGLMTEEQLRQAIAQQSEARVMLGELAVRLGYVTAEEMAYLIRLRTEESLYDLIGWEEGQFRFLEGELPERDPLEVELPLQGLLLEGFRQRDERRRMSRVVPDAKHVPVAVLGVELEAGDDEERDMVLAMDGRRSIDEIALACRLPEFAVLSFVHRLVVQEAVLLGPPAESPAPVPGTGAEPWQGALADIRDRLSSGRLLDALRLLGGLLEKYPDEPQVVALAMRFEGDIERTLDATEVDLGAILELAIDLGQLVKLECDPAEGFVLSRVNGRYTVQEVLSQLPGTFLHNRVILHNLLRRNLIRLRQKTSMARFRGGEVGRGEDEVDAALEID